MPRARDPRNAQLKEPRAKTAPEIISEYDEGERDFSRIKADGIDLSGSYLRDARFMAASLKGANFEGAILTHVQFKAANLEESRMADAAINSSDLISAKFGRTNMCSADLTGASLNRADFTSADMTRVNLGNAKVDGAILTSARLTGTILSSTTLSDIDATPFCKKRLKHNGPSVIDPRTVIKSYQVPGFKDFMLDCGIPEIFAMYMIDCAQAVNEPLLRAMMQTTFISYGRPDEAFAQKLHDALKAHGVVTFFFPESATWGERIDNEVFTRLQEYDRVILVCSRNSLDRPGVLHEIQETFDREARDGGATYLLPVTLDDYVFTDWRTTHPAFAERIGRRVVGDFRKAQRSSIKFNESLNRLLDTLKTNRPTL